MTTITYGTVQPTASGINLLVAKEEGFLAKNGINLEIKKLSNALTVLGDVGKSYEVASSFPPAEILADGQGLNLTVVTGLSYDDATHPLAALIVPAGSSVKSVRDLPGKTVGCVGLTNALYEGFSYNLHKNGISKSSVTAVAVPTIAQQAELSAHKIDAAVATYPSASQMAGAGMKNLGDPLRAVGDSVQSVNLVATKSWAASHKTLLAHLRKAVDEADNWMAANPTKVGPVLLKYTGQSAAAVQQTLKTLPGMSTAFTHTQFNEWMTVLKAVVPNFHSTVTYSELGAGVS